MAVKSTGSISFATDIVGEFGGTAPHAMSEYYKGGSRVPNISANANIAATGANKFGNFYGGLNKIIQTLANSTNVSLATTFGSDWTATTPKQVVIPSGVTIGGTGGTAALTASSAMGGTLEISVTGSVLGTGGASNGGAGGDAISNAASGVTLTVNSGGLVAGGGGGGGQGGTGGSGALTAQSPSNSGNNLSIVSGNYYNLRMRVQYGNTNSYSAWRFSNTDGTTTFGRGGSGGYLAGILFFETGIGSTGDTVLGGLTFSGFGSNYNGHSGINNIPGGSAHFNKVQFQATNNNPTYYNGSRTATVVGTASQNMTIQLGCRNYVGSDANTYYNDGAKMNAGGSGGSTTGGTGGAGGVGQGYNQTNASGSTGGTGGTNAGNGGTGGSGGTYAAAGSAGATGANGNSTNGVAGSSGGAAGVAVSGTALSAYTNNGTVHGTVST